MTLPVWPTPSADALERQLLDTWEAEGLFRRVQEARRDGPPFVFYEGPPTANGRPGIHHVFSRTIKDLICRFRTMQGRSVTRIAGWDTHGLPVEIEVEKQLKLTGKQDIERYGVEAFNALCRKSVFTYQADWVALSDRIGYWLDYENPFVTCSNDYVETVWWILHRLHERDMLYRGHRVLPSCPRCGTALSSHELALGYEEIRDRSIYVTLPLTDGSGWELVVWTTTPWTLPSNVAVAVHPELSYGVYRVERPTGTALLVVAESRAAEIKLTDGRAIAEHPRVAVVSGRELVGRRYERPLDVVPVPEGEGDVGVLVSGDFVTADDGSGMVHMAPAFGADDYATGQANGLALLRPVRKDGTFHGTTWPELEGRLVTADETNELIIRRLKADGRHLLTEQYVHEYPHCWRCRCKLIYYARDSWFVRTTAVKDRLVAENRAVTWQPPEVGAGRFGEWLANNVDWALSRDRYWGTPLPVWVCDRDVDHLDVIGSYARLAECWGRPLPDAFDPHRPYIDEYTWACACGGTKRRTPEVIDAWFDSGSMPYAQWHYPFAHEAEFAAHYPADFICEGVDQTRGWFYSLLAIAVTAFDSPAYRHVIVNEMVLDAEGQKMAKSRGNVVNPWEPIAEFGADTVRLYLLASSQVWLPKKFDPKAIPEVAGGFLNTLRNTYSFLAQYAGEPPASGDAGTPALADRWLRASLNRTVGDVTAAWERYDVTAGVKRIKSFVVDDLSNWYVRLNRSRFWAPDHDADPAAVAALRDTLVVVSRLLAPAAPFVSDWLHRVLTGGSVHLADFPVATAVEDTELIAAMDTGRTLASLGRAARESANIRVRQPLARMKVSHPASVRGDTFDAVLELVRQELNVRTLEIVGSDTDLVSLRARPNFRALGKRYGKRTPEVAALATGLPVEALRQLEAGSNVWVAHGEEAIEFLPEDVVVAREVATDWPVQAVDGCVVAIDPVLTEDLRIEGLAREMVSRIQRLRKDAGYNYADRIAVAVMGDPPALVAARVHGEFLGRETLARELAIGDPLPRFDREDVFTVDDCAVHLMVGRLDNDRPRSGPQHTEPA